MQNRKNNRLKTYDYSETGYYFVTICTKNKENWLGEISDEGMILNEYGRIAADYWQEIPKHYKNVRLDQWIIMPNHVHGIIIISYNVGTAHCAVPTGVGLLSNIVRSFKDVTVKKIRSEFADIRFAWQRSFYDHIIRNEYCFERTKEYIANNDKKWDVDIENSACLTEVTKDYYTNIFKKT